MGFTQRQAGGKFTVDEAAAFIEQLEQEEFCSRRRLVRERRSNVVGCGESSRTSASKNVLNNATVSSSQPSYNDGVGGNRALEDLVLGSCGVDRRAESS
ncbi:MAG: hypothetical protein R2706_16195 [Acidimicrobiales bacterium]